MSENENERGKQKSHEVYETFRKEPKERKSDNKRRGRERKGKEKKREMRDVRRKKDSMPAEGSWEDPISER